MGNRILERMNKIAAADCEQLAYDMLVESYFLGSMSDLQYKLKTNLKKMEEIEEYASDFTEEELKAEIKKHIDDIQIEFDEFTRKLQELKSKI